MPSGEIATFGKVRQTVKAYLSETTDANKLMNIAGPFGALSSNLGESGHRAEAIARLRRITELIEKGYESSDPQERRRANENAMKLHSILRG